MDLLWQSQTISSTSLNEVPKHFPKPNLHEQQIMVTVWWSAIGVVQYCRSLRPAIEWNAHSFQQNATSTGKSRKFNFASWRGSGNSLPGWHCKSSLIWDMRLCHNHHILLILYHLQLFFQTSAHVFTPKNIPLQREVETAFKGFSASKHLEFYLIIANNLINRWRKCIDVQGLNFDCLNSLILEQKFILKSVIIPWTNLYIYIYIYEKIVILIRWEK